MVSLNEVMPCAIGLNQWNTKMGKSHVAFHTWLKNLPLIFYGKDFGSLPNKIVFWLIEQKLLQVPSIPIYIYIYV